MSDDGISIPRRVPAPDPNTGVGTVHYLPACEDAARGIWPCDQADDRAPAIGIVNAAMLCVVCFVAGLLLVLAV